MSGIESTRLMDIEWLRRNFRCREACPVHTEAGKYVSLIAQGKYEEAYNVVRRANPFPSVCGHICAHPCEDSCRRKEIDEPISIRALKRFVCERYGVESGRRADVWGSLGVTPPAPNGRQKVAVVGAGPAGLACAHDLALLGYPVTVFEATAAPGGMLRLGVPEYRLPRDLLNREIQTILNLGIQLRTNVRIGEDLSITDLKQGGYKAIFIAIGAHKSRDLRIEGVELDGVLRAVEFLLNVNLGYRVEVGDKIIVIGGGNVAFDVARSAMRVGEALRTRVAANVTEVLDVARYAMRLGAREVDVTCLESRDEMPADKEEIEQSLEEGITLYPGRGPKRIIGKDGKAVGLETLTVESVFDSDGRFNPTFIEGSESVMEADTIIMAVGQATDLSFITPEDGIEVTDRGLMAIDPETLATSAPGIFAGGDVAFGPRIAIDAVADGKRAADSIHEFLSGERPPKLSVRISVHDWYDYKREEGYDRIPRQSAPTLPVDRRIGVTEIELPYDEETARTEAKRCLKCWINTEFEGKDEDGEDCILCGGCVNVCPESCIELISLGELEYDDELAEILQSAYGLSLDDLKENRIGAVMIKEEDRCIRCGLCAKRCPVKFITMEEAEFVEETALVGQ